jgi:hypothetical protein
MAFLVPTVVVVVEEVGEEGVEEGVGAGEEQVSRWVTLSHQGQT